jgi:2-polyprenyl-3-methyl-5-hydroxy-6-metoxy-1,4-benzoquinol methylase
METFDRKKHWEKIYQTRALEDASWYQPTPETSLEFFRYYDVPKTARIIDIGGGDSLLADHLLAEGYQNITVLDISEAAIARAKQRLGTKADQVIWMVADAASFSPTEKYDFWHDRAAFHFLTEESEISSYIQAAQQSISPAGILVVGTFSENGPDKCSGIAVRQYSETSMSDRLKEHFEKIRCITVDHQTPSGSIQNFVFCSFRKSED